MAKKVSGIELEVTIHKNHDLVTTIQNVANAESPIFRVTPGENQVLYFPNNNPVQLKLYDTAGDEIEDGAELSLWLVGPAGQYEEKIASALYAAWKNITWADQFDPKYEDAISIPFIAKRAAVGIRPGYKLEFRLKASTQVDWDNVNTRIQFGLGQEIMV